jgi:tRNA(fMet)-specific endonuclease VapC
MTVLYVLDTDHITLLQRNHPAVTSRFTALPPEVIAVTVESAMEQGRGRLAQIHRAKTVPEVINALARFQEALRSLPASERSYWILRLPTIDRLDKMSAIAFSPLYKSLLKFVFKNPSWVDATQNFALIVPSFGILQALLDARFASSAVKLLPGFGSTSKDAVVEGIGKGGRVFGLHFPEVEAPNYADGFHYEKLLFTLHDFFHAYVGSLLPLEFRRIVPRLIDIVRKEEKERVDQRAADEKRRKRKIFFYGSVDEIQQGFQAYINNLGDLFAGIYVFPWSGLGKTIRAETDKLGDTLMSAIARDWALHPDKWPGFNLDKEIRAFTPEARRVYKEIRKGLATSGSSTWTGIVNRVKAIFSPPPRPNTPGAGIGRLA